MEKMVQKVPLVGDYFHLVVKISDLVEKYMDWLEGSKVVHRNPNMSYWK